VISLLEAQYAAGVSLRRAAELVAQSVAREKSKILKPQNHIGGFS
jgi:hypothetical protein